jgi:protein-tyrosine phosphatase
VTPADILDFDRIITMDRENYANVMRLVTGRAPQVRMLSEYLDDTWPRDVPDPYYGGPEGFTFVLDMLEAACPKIISDVLSVD